MRARRSTLKEVCRKRQTAADSGTRAWHFDEPQSGIRPRGKSKREHHRPELQTRCLFVPVSSAGHENTAVSGEKTRILRDHRCACRSVRSLFPGGSLQRLPAATQMYVYPRQVDTARIQMICRAVSGMVLSRNRLYEDPFEFSGIRDYRKGRPDEPHQLEIVGTDGRSDGQPV